jgi:histidine triad (HIT) family protein
MPISDQEAKYIKDQLLKQIEKFPEDKREQLKKYINSMNNQQLEEFLVQNQMIAKEEAAKTLNPNNQAQSKDQECIFCLLSSKQIESFHLYEDKDYIAVLEINPLSKGHTLLIPKKHITEAKALKSKAFTLANKVGKYIIKKLKAENFQINSSDELKHAIINIIPTYKGEKIEGRKKAKKEELQETAMKIGILEKTQRIKKEKPKKVEEKPKPSIIKFPRRIP